MHRRSKLDKKSSDKKQTRDCSTEVSDFIGRVLVPILVKKYISQTEGRVPETLNEDQ